MGSILVLDDIHKRFHDLDRDDSGVIDHDEFEQLILQLHGCHDPSDMPKARLQFFWQQADIDGSGEIDFEEFIMWFKCYKQEMEIKSSSFKSKGTSLRRVSKSRESFKWGETSKTLGDLAAF